MKTRSVSETFSQARGIHPVLSSAQMLLQGFKNMGENDMWSQQPKITLHQIPKWPC